MPLNLSLKCLLTRELEKQMRVGRAQINNAFADSERETDMPRAGHPHVQPSNHSTLTSDRYAQTLTFQVYGHFISSR